MAIDPAAAYAPAIRTPGLLPNATVVVDQFHPPLTGLTRVVGCVGRVGISWRGLA